MTKIILFLIIFAMPAMAEVKTYQCGDDCTATLDEQTGVMRVSGTGAMWGYDDNYGRWHKPWQNENWSFKTVIVEDGITSVGRNAFFQCSNIETIELAQSVQFVDVGAFDEVDKVQSVTMYDETVWYDQDNFNQYIPNINLQISCYGDIDKCKANFLNTPKMKTSAKFSYKGKRIYTIEEAARVSKKNGNTFKLRYK
ncbi:MAG: leucine-rich repeat protein [Alphaproteobacteria bacterium]|nr:leucine-rich repeat protein [Alphaproteobacteria bacterium]